VDGRCYGAFARYGVDVAVIRQEDLEAACRAHIVDKRATLYGRPFVVTGHVDGREEAVTWLTGEVGAILERFGFDLSETK
jgi:hypothetical protein